MDCRRGPRHSAAERQDVRSASERPERPEAVRTDTFDLVDSRIRWSFPDLVAGMGGDAAAMMRRVGIDPRARPGGWTVSYRQMVELLALVARELDCADLGMRLARLQAGVIQSPLLQVFRNSLTLGEALKHVVDHSYAHSLATAIWLTPLSGRRDRHDAALSAPRSVR